MSHFRTTGAVKRTVERAAPFGAVLALWGLGLWRLGEASLWYDEIFSANMVLDRTWGELLHTLRVQQPYPPLYYLLLKAWSALVGARPYAPGLEPPRGLEELVRFPSLVASILALAVLTTLTRHLRLRAKVAVPLLFALHPIPLWYARDARMYAPLTLWLLLAILGLVAECRYVWILAASAALLTHYFALFPLAGAVLAGIIFPRQRWPLWLFLLPFVPIALWTLCAFPVTAGFQSFTTASPSLRAFLEELGPDLVSARVFLLPLAKAPDQAWGYGLLVVGVLGLVLEALKDPARGGIVASSFGLGALGLLALWQVRPVHHVRYLAWALPLILVGITEAPAALLGRLGGRWLALGGPLLLGPLIALGVLWGVYHSWALIEADRTLWYPDFRRTVAFLNARAREDDRGLAVADYGLDALAVYRSPVPFAAGPQIGDWLRPEDVGQFLTMDRFEGEGRWWLFLFQDEAVDPGGRFVGTLEAAGGHRVEIWYSRELRLFAYALPDGATLQPLEPEQGLEASFEGGIGLRGYSAHREGRMLAVYLFWELSDPQEEVLLGTVHLVQRPGERPLTQRDKLVLNNYWPLPKLPVGEVLADRYELTLPSDLPPGSYRLLAALYDPETEERRHVVGGGDMVDLGEIVIPWD